MKIFQLVRKNKTMLDGARFLQGLLVRISPTLFTKVKFRSLKGKKINLKNPQTFDEKISWLKLNTYKNNPLVSKCTDKYRVREYIAECGCSEILNELYGVYDRVEDIPWDLLPQKFALKLNHGCGFNIFCTDKQLFDIESAKKKLRKWSKAKYYLHAGEMQYKPIQPKIICEKLLETGDGTLLKDYKLSCFDGTAPYVMLCTERVRGKPKFYLFDRAWDMQPLIWDADLCNESAFPKPEGIDKMFEYAAILSKPFPYVRVDFYLVQGKIIFGELTFTPSGGIDIYKQNFKIEQLFGDFIKLPSAL